MSKPDFEKWGPLLLTGPSPAKDISTALQAAYDAGLERAAEMAEKRAGYYEGADYYGFASAIRAEKSQ